MDTNTFFILAQENEIKKSVIDLNESGDMLVGNISCDIPKEIVDIKKSPDSDEYYCQIKWNLRFDNSEPKTNKYSLKMLKDQYPFLVMKLYKNLHKINV